jgi:putative SOS response-associated peptidase YedK
MCGRYWLTSPADVLISRFRVRGEATPLHARWNAAPGQDLPVVRLAGAGERLLEPMRWGLVPAWAADPADAGRPINARAETAAAKPSFRESFRRRRALVPADGFYEWKRYGPVALPFAFRAKSREPFAIAGLWDEWRPREGSPLRTFTLLTTDASADVLRPLPAGALESFAVSPRLNSPEYDDPSVQEPSTPAPPKPTRPKRPESGVQRNLWENGDDDEAA